MMATQKCRVCEGIEATIRIPGWADVPESEGPLCTSCDQFVQALAECIQAGPVTLSASLRRAFELAIARPM
jgi:hypothetical protein